MSRARTHAARVLIWLLCLAVLPQARGAIAAAESFTVQQHNRAFSVSTLTIPVGSTIKFSNEDDFGHQIYVADPRFTFDSDESDPGNMLDVKFPVQGTFEVRCHIHPKMHLTVVVE